MNTLPFYGVGNLTADPELRYTPSGKPVTNFVIAHNPRHYDQNSGRWVDGTPTFLRGSVWGPQAENVAESLHTGALVVIVGRLVSRRWSAADGTERTALEIVADHIAPSLAHATATVTKSNRHPAPDTNQAVGGQPPTEEPPF